MYQEIHPSRAVSIESVEINEERMRDIVAIFFSPVGDKINFVVWELLGVVWADLERWRQSCLRATPPAAGSRRYHQAAQPIGGDTCCLSCFCLKHYFCPTQYFFFQAEIQGTVTNMTTQYSSTSTASNQHHSSREFNDDSLLAWPGCCWG